MDASNDTVMHMEMERLTVAIEKYGEQLEELNAAIDSIEEENHDDDVSRQLAEYENAMQASDKDLAAEDALDNMVRLQNQLKIVRRRNQLLARENNMQQKQLRDRAALLQKTSTELDKVKDITGWYGEFRDIDLQSQEVHTASIEEMRALEAQIRQELKGSRLLISKKEKAILQMQAEIEAGKGKETDLDQLHNDIRVKQRETREVQAKTQRMAHDDGNIDRALSQLELTTTSQQNSVACMESDKEFLSDAVSEMKLVCRRQDNVIKAQLARQQQLQQRLDVVMKSLREMRLAKEFERNVAKSALVPSASREEPEDVAQILPEDEYIPVDTYRLLFKNSEMMHTSVARKNMLVLEKESVIQAMESKLAQFIEMHNTRVQQDDGVRYNKEVETGDLREDLTRQHQDYRGQIEELVTENCRLKAQLLQVEEERKATMKKRPPVMKIRQS